jgi:MFS family permease
MSAHPVTLTRNHNFLKLWFGETVSQFGSQVTLLALPLVAAVTLRATPRQMGFLGAIEFAPFLVLGLFAGVWADRLRRRPILIAADLGRTVLLLGIPLADVFGALGMELLYIVALLTGICTVFFDVTYQAYLPVVVRRDQLVEGNSKLETSRSIAQIAGPGLAGALIQLITAPFAIVADAISFLISAGALAIIRVPESAQERHASKPRIWTEIGEGLQVVLGNPLLRSIAGSTSTSNLFSSMATALFILYATRDLGLSAGLLGVIFAAGNGGALVGALLASWITRRIGLGPAIVGPLALGCLGAFAAPLASGALPLVAAVLIAGWSLMAFGSVVYNINQVSLRQAIVAERLQGRMNATMRFLVWGTLPIGSLIGGALGGAIGLRPTLFVSAFGGLLAPLWTLFSPVRSLREQPALADEPAMPEATPAV